MVKYISTNRPQSIAEGGRIDKVHILVEKFGGEAKNWKKMKGWDNNGREYHWYQLKNAPSVGWKRAGEHDPF
ncbi:hypothetical protein [Psychrobacter lutiphocae]|uniref:hypothetical protein n=1 Tax=Psychrobacter lutiphocae TaxID=540500 RepID=UPI0003798E10|nr:hypothetical protein [Psychrobacter lutiphocae]